MNQGYPKKRVACRCSREMVRTHGKRDWACYECGTTVHFWVDPDGTWITAAQVARSEGVSEKAVARWCQPGRCPVSDLAPGASVPD